MCAADCLHAGFREAEVVDLAFADEFFDGSGDVLDRDVRVDALLVEQVDRADELDHLVLLGGRP